MAAYNYTYRVQIDFGHAGDYSHTLADVTARLTETGSLITGFQNPYADVAPPSKLDIKLRNDDNALTPDNTTSAYYGLLTRGTLIKFTASYNSVAYITWVGKIDVIRPAANRNANPKQGILVNIVAIDPMEQLLNAQIFPELQTDITISDALAYIIENAASTLVYPYPSSWSVLGVSTLGTAKLLDQDIFTSTTSTTTLPYYGDNSADNKNSVGAGQEIKTLMTTEFGGRIFWNGAKFEFQGRYYAIASALAVPALALTSADIESVDYVEGTDIVNDVTVTYMPRSVGTPASVIYSSEHTFSIGAGQTRKVTAHYRDPNTPTARIGAFDVLEMEASIDYLANSLEDGGGTNLTSFIFANREVKAQSASISLTNSGITDAYITTLQLRGTPLTTYERETVTAVDAQSIHDHGRYPRTYNFKLVADEATAQAMANIQISRFKDPIARFNNTTVVVNSLKLVTSTAAIGQTLTVDEHTNTKHAREYTIAGIQHRFDAGSRVHRTTYTLSPIAREQYWILGEAGFSELDSTAIIAL
jgi:hypothetical protein